MKIDAATNENFIYWKKFVCSKEGHRIEKACYNTVGQRRVMERRENCVAEFQVKKKKGDSSYSVCKFIAEHTHMLSTPHKSHMLRSHRMITPANAMGVFELRANGLRI